MSEPDPRMTGRPGLAAVNALGRWVEQLRRLGHAGLGMALLAWCAALLPLPGAAQTARPMADDPVLEARVLEIAHELRCLVCQNETIAASHADLALDLRRQIREQLIAGRSEREILDYMVQRYGDFVLYNPPVKPVTWLLWGGPFVLLVAMFAWLRSTLRRRRTEVPTAPLSDDELRRARELLGPDRS